MRLKTAKNQKRGPGKATKRKAALSAQQTIPYLVMHPDGVCQLPGGLYTKTVEYEDINYSVASTEDQTAIFGGWSSFLFPLSTADLVPGASTRSISPRPRMTSTASGLNLPGC